MSGASSVLKIGGTIEVKKQDLGFRSAGYLRQERRVPPGTSGTDGRLITRRGRGPGTRKRCRQCFLLSKEALT
eukprot:297491-Hanusia_phi.AAC.1